jgi:hypothetical protein
VNQKLVDKIDQALTIDESTMSDNGDISYSSDESSDDREDSSEALPPLAPSPSKYYIYLAIEQGSSEQFRLGCCTDCKATKSLQTHNPRHLKFELVEVEENTSKEQLREVKSKLIVGRKKKGWHSIPTSKERLIEDFKSNVTEKPDATKYTKSGSLYLFMEKTATNGHYYYKIGQTDDVNKRITPFSTGNSHPMELRKSRNVNDKSAAEHLLKVTYIRRGFTCKLGGGTEWFEAKSYQEKKEIEETFQEINLDTDV